MANRVMWPALKRSIVAILRGVQPGEVEAIAEILIDEQIEAIEVPLNSPEPFQSIGRVCKSFGNDCLIGAGTVLHLEQCDRVAGIGGRLLVSPNINPAIVARAEGHGMVTLPGVFTATEALLAVHSGASALKIFPAVTLGPSGVSALKTILPEGTFVGVVGGISDHNLAEFAKVGVQIFGLGTSLYKQGDDKAVIRTRAKAAVRAYDAAIASNRGAARRASII